MKTRFVPLEPKQTPIRMTLIEFADRHGLELVVMEDYDKLHDELNHEAILYSATFDGVNIKEGSLLYGATGDGLSPGVAIKRYADLISRRKLVVDSFGAGHRVIDSPQLLFGTNELAQIPELAEVQRKLMTR